MGLNIRGRVIGARGRIRASGRVGAAVRVRATEGGGLGYSLSTVRALLREIPLSHRQGSGDEGTNQEKFISLTADLSCGYH